MSAPFWNDNRVNVLVTCWNAGETGAVIADVLGCTRNMVIGKLYRLGRLGKIDKQEYSRRCAEGTRRSHASGTRKPQRKWKWRRAA